MISIPVNKLKAALTHAAVGDTRNYLNGVLVEITSNGTVVLVATDGQRAFIGTLGARVSTSAQEIIIPLDVVKLAIKVKGEITLAPLANGSWQLGAVVFSPLEGKFPDYRRIVPQQTSLDGSPAEFNWKYIYEAESALRLWAGSKNATMRLHTSGQGPAVATIDADDALAVVMPLRKNDTIRFADVFHVPR